jgi:hypothetical protein
MTVGPYNYIGCYTEGNGIRALEGAAFYDYPAMTLEECLKDCNGYEWWGVEYGGECWSCLFYCVSQSLPSYLLTFIYRLLW